MVFKDVFARSEFDFGDFTALVHWECPSPHPPVQGRCGGGEEEAHLKKMLNAVFIQPSISEWDSTSVLIWKKDG